MKKTNSLDKLADRIRKARNITASSLQVYIRNIKLLHRKVVGNGDFKNITFLNDFDRVKAMIETKALPTRKSYLASILVVLMLDKDKYSKLEAKYREYLDTQAKEYDKVRESQHKTLKQKDNWLSKEELRGVIDYYRKKIEKYRKKLKTTDFSRKHLQTLQQYLIASLYVLQPP